MSDLLLAILMAFLAFAGVLVSLVGGYLFDGLQRRYTGSALFVAGMALYFFSTWMLSK